MIIRNKIDANAMSVINDNSIVNVSGAMSISTDGETGNYINGPLSITTNLGNIRFSGVYKFNPLAASCIPSTLVTPISTFIIDVPKKNIAAIATITGLLLSTLGG